MYSWTFTYLNKWLLLLLCLEPIKVRNYTVISCKCMVLVDLDTAIPVSEGMWILFAGPIVFICVW